MIKVYADTSVFGGVFDDEFSRPSKQFFEEVESGRFLLVTSAIVQAEILGAPQQVQEFFSSIIAYAKLIDLTQEVLELRQSYLDAHIVTSKSKNDAVHVALATISHCNMIISWNFKYIVHFEKIPKYNAINRAKGYRNLDIFSPLEVINYDNA